MKKYLKNSVLVSAITLVGLVVAGCLVSGTFVIVEDVEFDFTANTGFYWYPVDLRGNSDWEDHKDDIDDIDAVGFEFKIKNTSLETCELNAWFVAAEGEANQAGPPPSTPGAAGQTKVIDGLVVAAGATRTVTYAESLGHISNLPAFKAIVKSGRFDYYGTSCGNTGDSLFVVTDGKIIVTVSASGS
ncbi:MAG: hypothetical protein AB1772_01930 [Candidatus Zixiibacteriota bacterium]